MQQCTLTLTENLPLAPGVFRMTLRGDPGPLCPGQFVNLRLPGFFLRRPISVCDADADTLVLIFKTVGGGTELMSGLLPGRTLDVLSGLGNGYDLSLSGETPLLLGGGAGVPPLFFLARRLIAEGKHPAAVLGFNSAEEVFCEEEFRNLGCEVSVATVDGSRGIRGFVTDAMPSGYSYFYACGPEPMLRAVNRAARTSGQFSFEERMGCGFGACMGCSCRTVDGFKRICRDGPVLRKEEILWED